MMLLAALLVASVLAAPQSAPPAASAAVIAPQADVDTLSLVRSSGHKAVVRIGVGSDLVVLEVGDRVGRTSATVREIAEGRLVLDEVVRDRDGRPHRAELVFRAGQTSGRRYTREPGVDAPPAVRPEIVGPDGKPITPKKRGNDL